MTNSNAKPKARCVTCGEILFFFFLAIQSEPQVTKGWEHLLWCSMNWGDRKALMWGSWKDHIFLSWLWKRVILHFWSNLQRELNPTFSKPQENAKAEGVSVCLSAVSGLTFFMPSLIFKSHFILNRKEKKKSSDWFGAGHLSPRCLLSNIHFAAHTSSFSTLFKKNIWASKLWGKH